MSEADPPGYRCECRDTRLEHAIGGGRCEVDGCTCPVFRASMVLDEAIESPQEDDTMTIHAVKRDDDMDQSAPAESDEAAPTSSNGTIQKQEEESEADPKPTVHQRIAAIKARRSAVLASLAEESEILLKKLDDELGVAEAEVKRILDDRSALLESIESGGHHVELRPPTPAPLAKTRGSVARASNPSPVKAASRAAKSNGQSFTATLIAWVLKHPWNRLQEMKEAFPKEKPAKLSQTLMIAKKKGVIKSKGEKGSMKWGPA